MKILEIKTLKNSELHSKLKTLCCEERKLNHEVILHIMEVDRRKLFLEMAYPSLFQYLVSAIGYSPASAQRRTDAARLMMQVPDLGLKLEKGSISLSQVSILQKAFRQARKSQIGITAEQKQNLVAQIENKDPRQTQAVLAQAFDLPVIEKEIIKIQKDGSVRIEMTFSKEELAQLEHAERLLGHALGRSQNHIENSGPLKNMILYCARKVAEQKTKKQIQKADSSCQYYDPKSRKTCGSQQFLEIDHIQPRWAGGSNSPDNLRILCRQHNQYRYQVGR